MEQIVIYLLIVQKLLSLKQNVVTPLCLKSISKDFSVDNMKKTGLNGYVDYDAIAVDDILNILKNLIKKNNIM